MSVSGWFDAGKTQRLVPLRGEDLSMLVDFAEPEQLVLEQLPFSATDIIISIRVRDVPAQRK